MIILTPEEAAIASAIVVILYGIIYEKRVTYTSILFNIMSFLVLLASTDLPVSVFLVLLTYTIVGYVVAKLKVKALFPFFGSKSFGSLMFVIVLGSSGLIFGIYSVESVILLWIIVLVVVYSIYWFLNE